MKKRIKQWLLATTTIATSASVLITSSCNINFDGGGLSKRGRGVSPINVGDPEPSKNKWPVGKKMINFEYPYSINDNKKVLWQTVYPDKVLKDKPNMFSTQHLNDVEQNKDYKYYLFFPYEKYLSSALFSVEAGLHNDNKQEVISTGLFTHQMLNFINDKSISEATRVAKLNTFRDDLIKYITVDIYNDVVKHFNDVVKYKNASLEERIKMDEEHKDSFYFESNDDKLLALKNKIDALKNKIDALKNKIDLYSKKTLKVKRKDLPLDVDNLIYTEEQANKIIEIPNPDFGKKLSFYDLFSVLGSLYFEYEKINTVGSFPSAFNVNYKKFIEFVFSDSPKSTGIISSFIEGLYSKNPVKKQDTDTIKFDVEQIKEFKKEIFYEALVENNEHYILSNFRGVAPLEIKPPTTQLINWTELYNNKSKKNSIYYKNANYIYDEDGIFIYIMINALKHLHFAKLQLENVGALMDIFIERNKINNGEKYKIDDYIKTSKNFIKSTFNYLKFENFTGTSFFLDQAVGGVFLFPTDDDLATKYGTDFQEHFAYIIKVFGDFIDPSIIQNNKDYKELLGEIESAINGNLNNKTLKMILEDQDPALFKFIKKYLESINPNINERIEKFKNDYLNLRMKFETNKQDN
ncbi:hypothetical protein GE118_04190 [Mycoplasma sp. NEAQ87857]|uniref:hypothetical protein n=1 Tax=Mycoplasma sp. NEAQ87857 TaxID=2683967 RepID=UPI0013198D5D|nr:hypothetical protein [Mycoplasma sp. NEAQ87857]QGZ97976.1 hypothetical protein GE118_04190 [Mycoplasma sp. NEAQ87857]